MSEERRPTIAFESVGMPRCRSAAQPIACDGLRPVEMRIRDEEQTALIS
jgi:hypothetical protein